MTKNSITRASFEALSPMDRAAAARSHQIVDPPSEPTPEPTRLVHIENGTRTVYTRTDFDRLPVWEQSRIGARLRIENMPPSSATDANADELAEALLAKLKQDAA